MDKTRRKKKCKHLWTRFEISFVKRLKAAHLGSGCSVVLRLVGSGSCLRECSEVSCSADWRPRTAGDTAETRLLRP